MWRIRRIEEGVPLKLGLSGRILENQLAEFHRALSGESAGRKMQLDLSAVTLIDQGIVKYLAYLEANGVDLVNCAPYLREWIDRSAGQEHAVS
jgi:hypothetical protein